MKCLLSVLFGLSLLLVPVANVSGAEQTDTSILQTAVGQPRINVKMNTLLFLGFINPAVEFKVMKKWTVQMEALGVFYPYNFMGTGKPLVMGTCFGEFRYYPKTAFKGFYLSPNLGFSVYKLNKGLVPGYKGAYEGDYYQQGYNVMAGVTLGYQWNIGKHWSLELAWGAGYQHSVYHGFNRGGKDEPYVEYYIGRNASAEWLPLYKGGFFVGYRF